MHAHTTVHILVFQTHPGDDLPYRGGEGPLVLESGVRRLAQFLSWVSSLIDFQEQPHKWLGELSTVEQGRWEQEEFL